MGTAAVTGLTDKQAEAILGVIEGSMDAFDRLGVLVPVQPYVQNVQPRLWDEDAVRGYRSGGGKTARKGAAR